MRRLRTTWFAGLGAVLLLVLTVSGVFGAERTSPGRGVGLSLASGVMALLQQADEDEEPENELDENDDEEPEDELGEDEEPENELDGDEDGGPTGNHGACVSAVARGLVVLDGEFGNHGAMVSYAARVTCWQPAEPEDTDDEEEEEQEEEETEVDEPEEEVTTGVAPTRSERTGPPSWVLERKAGDSAKSATSNERTGGKALGKNAGKGKAYGRGR